MQRPADRPHPRGGGYRTSRARRVLEAGADTLHPLQILALFESSSHPEHSQARADAALQFVDRIVQTLSLPMIDIDDREVCTYSPRSIPVVYHPSGYAPPERCGCIRGAASPQSPASPPTRYSYSFSHTPPWDEQAPVEERRREECRRICWSALNLIANYTAQCAAFHQDPIELSLMEPSNVRAPLSASPVRAADAARAVLCALPRGGVRAAARQLRAGPVAQGRRVGAVLPQHAAVDELRAPARHVVDGGRARRLCDPGVDRVRRDPGRARDAHVQPRHVDHVPRARVSVQVRPGVAQ